MPHGIVVGGGLGDYGQENSDGVRGGQRPDQHVGNGMDVTSPSLEHLSQLVNSIASKRGKILVTRAVDFTNLSNSANSDVFAAAFRTSPGPKIVVAHLILLPAGTTATSVQPRLKFQFQASPSVPGATITQPAIHVGPRNTGTLTPTEMFEVVQRYDGLGGTTKLDADTEYLLAVESRYAPIMALCLYEEPASSYTATSPIISPPADFSVGSPVLDTSIDTIGDRLDSIYKKQAPPIFSWGLNGRIGANDRFIWINSTNYVNVFETTTTSYDANAPSYWAFPRHMARYGGTSVPCVFYAKASTTGTGTSNVKLIDSVGTLSELTISGTSSVYVSGTCSLDSSQDAQLVQVHAKTTGSAVSVVTFGLYRHES